MSKHNSRRHFLKQSMLMSGTFMLFHDILPFVKQSQQTQTQDLDAFISDYMQRWHVPGLAACLVRYKDITWSGAYGWADIEHKKAMTTDDCIMNIGSISKTVVATAIMQLIERNELDMVEDINRYLPFHVSNPAFPEIPITIQQLLTHRSSIMDGPAYQQSYVCGQTNKSLGDWLFDYLAREGSLFDPDDNFHSWQPGETGLLPFHPRNYSNIGFGLLAYLVELKTGSNFREYCHEHVFEPLGMTNTSWLLTEEVKAKHVTPYSYIREDFRIPPGMTYDQLMPRYPEDKTPLTPGTYWPHCLYSFPNYPDGLLRTTLSDLSKFLISIINAGQVDGMKILEPDSVQNMLCVQNSNDPIQGLCWMYMGPPEGPKYWGHDGGDPGVNTSMFFDASRRIGVVVLQNCSESNPYELMTKLFDVYKE